MRYRIAQQVGKLRFKSGDRVILDPTLWTRFTMDARFDKGITRGIERESLIKQH